MPPTFDPITGVPHAIASRPTSPSGSSLDGKINIVAILYIFVYPDLSIFFKNITETFISFKLSFAVFI